MKKVKPELPPFAEYKVKRFTWVLPETYVSQDLKGLKPESSCIAIYKDSENKLPELWVYAEEKLGGKEFKDKFAGINVSTTSNTYLFFYERWYGEILINELYFQQADADTLLYFDFVYNEEGANKKHEHALITEIVRQMGLSNR